MPAAGYGMTGLAAERLDQGALLEVVKDGLGYRGPVEGIGQRTFGDTLGAVLR